MVKKQKTNKKVQKAKVVDQTWSDSHYAVSKYLGELKFSSRIMGVDEADVWKKIEKLCELYEAALAEEQGKSEKLTQQLKVCAAKLKKMMDAEKRAEEAEPNG